ncbi:DUF3043 domain-containing protein [Streptomyces calidiresistens]|uniref:DUF3043 domain-containing protein n=1 Tax=Streptomyces calidiresistens TaxID=1485586 RepID=A0A7W3T743_9ACTN|nr:DUF3043 domain-containing protein [Streptomyces calidiresistens]MBB0232154.1 DUF3043 domain-containing protein [Streptomyces calidiresistens]
MFRSRSKENQSPRAAEPTAEEASRTRDPQAPKGRPTPKRSEAEALRKASARPPTDRREAARRAREARRKALEKQREALVTGREEFLPYRDRGPVRRFARDFVDTRWHVAEYFLIYAIIILVLSMVPGQQPFALLLWMGIILAMIVDWIALRFRLKRALNERFPNESHKGAYPYALMRTLQVRRLRLPKPQVKRGEAPR